MTSESVAENGQGVSSEEERFVSEALLPFLLRCRPLKQPSTMEVAALTWGYQAAQGKSVSPFGVAQLLRRMINENEQTEDSHLRSVRGLVEALQLAEAAMPEVAASFWHCGGSKTSP